MSLNLKVRMRPPRVVVCFTRIRAQIPNAYLNWLPFKNQFINCFKFRTYVQTVRKMRVINFSAGPAKLPEEVMFNCNGH